MAVSGHWVSIPCRGVRPEIRWDPGGPGKGLGAGTRSPRPLGPTPSGRPGRVLSGRRPAEGAAGGCHRAPEGACPAAGRQQPGQLCGVLRPRPAALPGAAAASRAPGRGARGRAARGGQSGRAPWPGRAAPSRRVEPRPPARHGRLPRARRRPGLGPMEPRDGSPEAGSSGSESASASSSGSERDAGPEPDRTPRRLSKRRFPGLRLFGHR